jgi:hypothetical protein
MSVYRWAYGHIDYATLTADDTAIVANFPNSGAYNYWSVETNGSISYYTQRVVTPSLREYALGSPSTLWNVGPLNFEQAEWLMDNRFPQRVLTAPATIMTYRSNNPSGSGDARRWVVLQCIARLESITEIDNTENVSDTWLRTFNVRFVRGTFLAPPP